MSWPIELEFLKPQLVVDSILISRKDVLSKEFLDGGFCPGLLLGSVCNESIDGSWKQVLSETRHGSNTVLLEV